MFRQYRRIERGEFILVGYDLAMGGDDFCAATFLSKTHNDVPLIYQEREIATKATNSLLPIFKRIQEETGVAPVVAPEANAGGAYEIDRMLNSPYAPYFRMYQSQAAGGRIESPEPTTYGWKTNSATRPKMLEELKSAIDGRLIQIYDEPLINELFSFVVVRTTSGWKATAEQGMHDDLIISLAIAWQLYQTENPMQEVNARNLPQNDFRKWELG